MKTFAKQQQLCYQEEVWMRKGLLLVVPLLIVALVSAQGAWCKAKTIKAGINTP